MREASVGSKKTKYYIMFRGIALGTLLGCSLFHHFYRIAIIGGESMNSEEGLDLRSGEHGLMLFRRYRYHTNPTKGDVVMMRQKMESGWKLLVKRIIALGGEDVSKTENTGYLLKTVGFFVSFIPFVRLVCWTNRKIVPKGHCWVEGDNKRMSLDSRHFGPVPLNMLIGRGVFVTYFSRWRERRKIFQRKFSR